LVAIWIPSEMKLVVKGYLGRVGAYSVNAQRCCGSDDETCCGPDEWRIENSPTNRLN